MVVDCVCCLFQLTNLRDPEHVGHAAMLLVEVLVFVLLLLLAASVAPVV